MRISDWSSDVCSSDLPRYPDLLGRDQLDRRDRGDGLMTGAYGEAYDDAYDTLSAGSGGVGGWHGLLGILSTAQQDRRDHGDTPPIACPVHGEPLASARGLLHLAVVHKIIRASCRDQGWREVEI